MVPGHHGDHDEDDHADHDDVDDCEQHNRYQPHRGGWIYVRLSGIYLVNRWRLWICVCEYIWNISDDCEYMWRYLEYIWNISDDCEYMCSSYLGIGGKWANFTTGTANLMIIIWWWWWWRWIYSYMMMMMMTINMMTISRMMMVTKNSEISNMSHKDHKHDLGVKYWELWWGRTEATHFSMFTLVAFFFVSVAFRTKSDTPNCKMQSDKAIFGIREIQGQGLNCEFVFVCLYLCICNLLIVKAKTKQSCNQIKDFFKIESLVCANFRTYKFIHFRSKLEYFKWVVILSNGQWLLAICIFIGIGIGIGTFRTVLSF